jgi:hypothetical protein
MFHPHLKCHGIIFLAMASSAVACLPKDTRPPPASVFVTASSDDAVKQGFYSDDGWHINFSRFVVSMGRTNFDEGGSCVAYSDSGYMRVLDLQQPEPQKVGLIYGLGQCDFGFRVANPQSDSLLGEGVSPADELYMQTAGNDNYTAARGFTGARASTGVTAIINGVATGPNGQKSFSWSFRQNLEYTKCFVETDAGVNEGLNLTSSESDPLNILVRGETLFQTDVTLTGKSLKFGPMALADTQYGNNDGTVSIDELGLVPIHVLDVDGSSIGGLPPPSGSAGDYVGGNLSVFNGGGVTAMNNLEAFVYSVAFPMMFHYRDTGRCVVAIPPARGR